MLEKLKLFGNKTPNITSLYDMNGVKKTLNIFGKAKLGNLAKQTGEPMNRGDARSDLEPPAIPQWLVDLRKRKANGKHAYKSPKVGEPCGQKSGEL